MGESRSTLLALLPTPSTAFEALNQLHCGRGAESLVRILLAAQLTGEGPVGRWPESQSGIRLAVPSFGNTKSTYNFQSKIVTKATIHYVIYLEPHTTRGKGRVPDSATDNVVFSA